ncbi:rhamnogalacturonan acetylesterase [Pedobacter polaris]|uniref:Rhamnogalacturonan acetylesterase n=1 Tax=Pedobacter polaris TaxID=2571273 RepID=A0A4U1CSF8_9SPHI|nr:GDSL-type esterase/lipase family protein [Pedobacter polaris]TKC10446.1 rhamnogalacturonan acetylesterase [Pedobacter polaris]
MNIKKINFIILFALLGNCSIAQVKTTFNFDFSKGKNLSNCTTASGAGFDFDTKMSKEGSPFYFSVNVPEGNYQVTVILSSTHGTFVKAESRRLMLEDVQTKAGQFVKKTFIVNIKNKKINDKETVKLKERELTKLDWDNKLTLEFDKYVVLKAITIKKVEDQVTVFLAGNSTVVNGDYEPWAAWGQMIPRFFKPGVAIANHAESGLTLGSFLGSKRLDKIMSVMKRGDYLFVEFGHNDQKDKGPDDGAYKSYTERLKLFVSRFREKGGIPVIVTSTTRRSFDKDGKIQNSLGDFPDAARKVAAQEGVALIDLNQLTTILFNAMGVEPSKKAFVHYPANTYPGQNQPLADNTHFSPYGAYEIAKCIVEGIKSAKLPLANFLIDPKQKFNPAQPDGLDTWHWPESLQASMVKPDGN